MPVRVQICPASELIYIRKTSFDTWLTDRMSWRRRSPRASCIAFRNSYYANIRVCLLYPLRYPSRFFLPSCRIATYLQPNDTKLTAVPDHNDWMAGKKTGRVKKGNAWAQRASERCSYAPARYYGIMIRYRPLSAASFLYVCMKVCWATFIYSVLAPTISWVCYGYCIVVGLCKTTARYLNLSICPHEEK